jgi:oligopeptide transport system substrate-binding protein
MYQTCPVDHSRDPKRRPDANPQRLNTGWLGLLCLLLLAGCEHGSDSQLSYRHALDGVPGSLDPVHASDIYSSTMVLNIFDTLYRYRYLARPYEIAPNLAESLPDVSDDGLIWTIRLRPGVHFAEDPAFGNAGTRELVADDVVFSLRRHFDPAARSRTGWLLRERIEGLDQWGAAGADPAEPIVGLEALDPHTLRIRLTSPFPQLLNVLAMAPMAIVPHEAVAYYGPEFGRKPIGSGPFQLSTRDESRAVLVPNPAFQREVLDLAAEGYDPESHGQLGLERLDGRSYPFIERLEFHFINEPSARWYSYLNGEVDSVTVPPDQAHRLLDADQPGQLGEQWQGDHHGMLTVEAGFVFHGFNMANVEIGHHPEPGRNERNRALRCAMRDGFDWQQRLRSFDHGLGIVFPGALPPILGLNPQAELEYSTRFEPERARAQLEQSEWHAGNWPGLVYGLESNLQQRQMFEQFRGWMQELGMPGERLQARSFASFADYLRAIGRRELDFFLMSWTLAYPDPHYSLQLFYGPNAAPGANSFNYANAEFDRLFERAAGLADGPERQSLYARLNTMLVEDCVIIGSMSRTRLLMWNPRLAMQPDRDVLGGHFIRFVGPAE